MSLLSLRSLVNPGCIPLLLNSVDPGQAALSQVHPVELDQGPIHA